MRQNLESQEGATVECQEKQEWVWNEGAPTVDAISDAQGMVSVEVPENMTTAFAVTLDYGSIPRICPLDEVYCVGICLLSAHNLHDAQKNPP